MAVRSEEIVVAVRDSGGLNATPSAAPSTVIVPAGIAGGVLEHSHSCLCHWLRPYDKVLFDRNLICGEAHRQR
jgi:hypothetical protein